MAASRTSYLVTWEGHSQVFGCASKEGALETPPIAGCTMEQKKVFFITQQPDNGVLCVHEIPQEEVLAAELKFPKPRSKKKDDEQDTPTDL